jgi:hypothetical protein
MDAKLRGSSLDHETTNGHIAYQINSCCGHEKIEVQQRLPQYQYAFEGVLAKCLLCASLFGEAVSALGFGMSL